MKAIAIGPFVFSNDRFIAIFASAAFLLCAEFIAWRRPDAVGSIRRWAMISFSLSLLIGAVTFQIAELVLPDETRGQIPTGMFMDMAGNETGLATGDGRPLVMNLWAMWCPPCRREMPMMTSVATAREDVAFVFANQGEQEETIQSYLRKNGLPFEGMIQDADSTLITKFGMLGLPSTLFFSPTGQLQAVHTGEISRAALAAQIRGLKGNTSED